MAVVWTVVSTERETTNNGITVVHWTALDSEDVGSDPVVTHSGSSYGSCSLTPDHTSSDFIAYASLTEANVVAWVKEILGADMVTETEAGIAAQIAVSKAPVVAHGVPWG
jgi:endonuclease IV